MLCKIISLSVAVVKDLSKKNEKKCHKILFAKAKVFLTHGFFPFTCRIKKSRTARRDIFASS